MSAHLSSKSRFIWGVLALTVLVASAWGAGFWDKKHFTQWTEKEVQRTLNNSPWAKSVKIPLAAATAGGLPSGGGGGGRGRGGAPGAGGGGGLPGGGGGGGRRGGGGGAGAGMPTASQPSLDLLIRFNDALPVRHANVKQRLGESDEITPEFQNYIDSEATHYVVAVAFRSQRTTQMLGRFGANPERLIGTAKLRRKGKDDIVPEKVEVLTEPFAIFLYYFPRTDPIEVADKAVEFAMRLAPPAGAQAGGQRRPGQGQGGPRAGQQQGQQPGQGGQRRAGGGQAGRQGGGGRNPMAQALFNKEIKKSFRLKDMVYDGRLAL